MKYSIRPEKRAGPPIGEPPKVTQLNFNYADGKPVMYVPGSESDGDLDVLVMTSCLRGD